MRIKLDLSQFLEDERKFSVVKVNLNETRTVRDVLIKISKLFNVSVGIEEGADASKKPTLGLFEDENFYIHPDETATVLQDTGVLKLKALPKHGGRKKKKSKKEPPEDEVSLHDDEKKEKKRKREKVDEELLAQNSTSREEKKEKRLIRLSEDPINVENEEEEEEEEEGRKIRKRKRSRILEESGGHEGYEYPIQKKSKKSRNCEEVSEDEDETTVRQRGKSKRIKLDDLTSEEEEIHGKKKLRKSKGREESEVEHIDEIVEVSVPRKRKSKKDVELIMEEKKKYGEFSTQLDLKTTKKRGGWSVIDEELYERKAHVQAEGRKGKSMEEKNSQEKVVSTSSVINLETEEALEDSDVSSSTEASSQKYHTESKFDIYNSKHFAADSMTDPLTVDNSISGVSKKRRKRKRHNKQGKQWQEQGAVLLEPTYSLEVNSKPSTSLAHNSNYQWPGRSQQPILNSNFTRKHVYFSDNEEVTNNEENSLRDIEILETAPSATAKEDSFKIMNRPNFIGQVTGRTRKINSDDYTPKSYDSAQTHFAETSRSEDISQNTTRQRIVPVDLEEEDGDSLCPSKTRLSVSDSKTIPSTSSSNFDELATLRRICENKTITVCKVDAKKEQAKHQTKEAIPSTAASSSFLSPPSPVHVPQRPSVETAQTFRKLMKMQNGPATTIQTPRNVVQLDDTDLSNFRNTESQNSTHDVNGKVAGNHLSSDNKKAIGQGPPGSGIVSSASSRSSSALQQLHNRQGGHKGEVTEVTRTEEYRETQTTKVLSNIINEASQRVPPTNQQSRSRETMQRVPQSLGALLSSLRDQNSRNAEKDGGELEVLGNSLPTITTPEEHSSLKRQLLTDRQAQTQETHLKTQFPGVSARTNASPARQTNQHNHTVPTKMESEVVDLESEEEIEIPVPVSAKVKTPNSARNLVERIGSSESVIFSKKEVKDLNPNSESKSIVEAAGIFKGKSGVSNLVVSEGGRHKENIGPSGIMQDTARLQDLGYVYEDVENEESPVEDEEEYDDEVRVEEDEDGTEADPEVIEDYGSDDELGDIPPELRAVSKSEESNDNESEMTSRLKKCLEKFSHSFTKSNAESEDMLDTELKQKCEEKNSKIDCGEIIDTRAKLGNEKFVEIAGKVEDNQKEVASTVKTQDENEVKPSTSQAKSLKEEVEEVVMEEADEQNCKEGTSISEEPHPMKEELKEEWLKKCPVMKDPPTTGQYIAVKRLVVEDAYCPIYSDYLQARVVKVEGTKVHLSFVGNSKEKKNPGRGVEEVDLTSEEAGLEKEGEGAAAIEEFDWRDFDEPRLLSSKPMTLRTVP